MRISVKSKGPNLASLIDQQTKALVQGQRKAGAEIGKVGAKAIKDDTRSRRGTLRFQGKSIGVRYKNVSNAAGASVQLNASPAGAWAIINDGAKPHPITPHGRALKFGATYATRVSHPGTTGTKVWDQAEAALDRAVFPVVEDAADEAFS